MKPSAESYRLMRWWSSDDTPEDVWVVEGQRPDGLWIQMTRYYTDKLEAVLSYERLSA